MSSSQKQCLSLFLISLATLIPACTPAPAQYIELDSRVVETIGAQSILIQVDYGEVTILKSESDRVEIEGQVLFADELEYQVNSTEEQITIRLFAHRDSPSRIPLQVSIHVPGQMQVKVETDKASVLVQEYQGDVEIDSISGNITVEQMTGAMTLHSNRGNITVRESLGNVSVAGNYGLLTLENTNGNIGVSTIMGAITFNGSIRNGDTVRLETDHGAVSVHLSADSALTLHVRSTSGDVACMLPNMTSTTRTCDGEINSGGGSLAIRTVSGAVTVQSLP
jgi:DUF4097 and DUF4098 domain-containing protein YvlB